MKKILPMLSLLWLSIISCTPEPQSIAYGDDLCHFCKMNIVDPQHAAELVTTKGKVFTFDAIECMVNFQQKKENTDYAFQLVNDFEVPASLIDAKSSYYLISTQLPSPMGANLNAIANTEAAMDMRDLKKGEVFNWTDLQNHLLKK